MFYHFTRANFLVSKSWEVDDNGKRREEIYIGQCQRSMQASYEVYENSLQEMILRVSKDNSTREYLLETDKKKRICKKQIRIAKTELFKYIFSQQFIYSSFHSNLFTHPSLRIIIIILKLYVARVDDVIREIHVRLNDGIERDKTVNYILKYNELLSINFNPQKK